MRDEQKTKEQLIHELVKARRIIAEYKQSVPALEKSEKNPHDRQTALSAVAMSVRESAQRLSQIIDFLPDVTFVINLKGEVIAWNRAIAEMTGVPARIGGISCLSDHESSRPDASLISDKDYM